MLEKIRTVTGTKFAQLILALITVPFALWGVESYIRTPSGQDVVADVAGQRVTIFEFDQAIKNQQDRFRAMLGKNYDPQMMDNPQVRSSILDELINERLVIGAAAKVGLAVSDATLAERIATEPAFQENGKFSTKFYEAALRNSGLTPVGYEASMRRDIERSQFQDSIMRTAFAGSVPAGLFLNALEQSREVSVINLTPEEYSAKVKIDSAAIKAYYEKNKTEFTVPEQVRVQYIELSLDALAAQAQVTADEVRKFYDENSARYLQKEQRKASHILITVAANAPETEKKVAREKAQKIFEEVKKNPKSFAQVAKSSSQDPGSAAQGGDLGFFARGAMVKPFEDAVFGMKKNEIVGPVQSEFGYHIILLTEIRPEKGKSIAEATPEIEAELKKQKAATRFAEVAQSFSDKVFEQSTALEPIASELKLQTRSSDWFSKVNAAAPFNSPKLAQAIFSQDTLRNKRNTEAVEVAPNVLISARVVDHKPAEQKAFATVEKDIERRRSRQEAAKLATQEGVRKLELLKAGKNADLKWPAPLAVSRQATGALPPDVINRALKANTGKLPAYLGMENAQGGYTLVQITKVIAAPAADEGKLKNYRQRFEQVIAQQELQSLLDALRKDLDVKIHRELMEKKPGN